MKTAPQGFDSLVAHNKMQRYASTCSAALIGRCAPPVRVGARLTFLAVGSVVRHRTCLTRVAPVRRRHFLTFQVPGLQRVTIKGSDHVGIDIFSGRTPEQT